MNNWLGIRLCTLGVCIYLNSIILLLTLSSLSITLIGVSSSANSSLFPILNKRFVAADRSMIGALFNTCTKRPRLENESVLWQRAAHVSILSQPSKESEISTRPPRSVVRYRLSRHDCLLPSSSYLVCLFAFPSITSPLYPTLGNPSYLTVHDRGPFLTPLPAASTPTERTVPASTSSSSSHTCSRYVVRVSVFKHDRAHEKVSRQHSAIVSGGSSDRTQ